MYNPFMHKYFIYVACIVICKGILFSSFILPMFSIYYEAYFY